MGIWKDDRVFESRVQRGQGRGRGRARDEQPTGGARAAGDGRRASSQQGGNAAGASPAALVARSGCEGIPLRGTGNCPGRCVVQAAWLPQAGSLAATVVSLRRSLRWVHLRCRFFFFPTWVRFTCRFPLQCMCGRPGEACSLVGASLLERCIGVGDEVAQHLEALRLRYGQGRDHKVGRPRF
jgi:hypothetical protein